MPLHPRQISLLKICLPPLKISIVAALLLIASLEIRINTKVHKIVDKQTTLRQTSTPKTPINRLTLVNEEGASTKTPILPTPFEVQKNNTANMEATPKTQLWGP